MAKGMRPRYVCMCTVGLLAACSSEFEDQTESAQVERLELNASDNDNPTEYDLTPAHIALENDLAIIAERKGWSHEQAMAHHLAATAVGEAGERLFKLDPELFVGSIVDSDPGAPPTLLVKGTAGQAVRDMVAQVERETDVSIIVRDEQPFSFDELEERVARAHRAIAEVGYGEVATGADITNGGRIWSVIRRKEGLPSSAEELVSRVPAEVRELADLEFVDAAMNQLDAMHGGMAALDDGWAECTFGWSVVNLSGSPVFGTTTASHCTGINEALYPQTNIEATTLQAQEIGEWGDFEWHSPTYTPTDDFRADTSDYRDTTGVEALANLSVGETVCSYAPPPWGDDRDCSTVRDRSVSCTLEGYTYDRLVQMETYINQEGESGGGWSNGNTAYGSHTGQCGSRSVYSNADRFDEGLNVQVYY